MLYAQLGVLLLSDDAHCPRDMLITLRPLAGDMQASPDLDLRRSVQV